MTENTATATKTAAAAKAAPKPAPRRAPQKATTAKAPAKTAAKKVVAATGKKVRWVVGQVHPNGKDQAGQGLGGTQYAITRGKDGQFTAMVKTPAAQKPSELVTGSFSAAYWAAVNHNKAAVEKAAGKDAAKTDAVA